jgi:heme-degrading monooxygenase HmoA
LVLSVLPVGHDRPRCVAGYQDGTIGGRPGSGDRLVRRCANLVGMRVTTRHLPADPGLFIEAARAALIVLGRQPGFVAGELGRSPDVPEQFLLTTRWRDVGSMRRGMGGFEAKVALAPVMATAVDEVSVFEVLLEVADGAVRESDSARAPGDATRF